MKRKTLFILCVLSMILFFQPGTAHTEEISKAKDIYLTKCAKCHKFYNPSKYDDARWRKWMEKMKKKAHLDNEEYGLLIGYCNSLRKGASAPPQ